MKIHTLFVLLAAAALAGCETTVDLPEPPHTPRVALLYTLNTAPQDSSFQDLYDQRQLFISNSQNVFNTARLDWRPDATVELQNAAGTTVERYKTVRSVSGFPGSYRPLLGFRPQVGQTYTLRATLPGMETAESTFTMPQPAVITGGTFTPRANGSNNSPYEYRGHLNVTLRDDPAEVNYYIAYARLLDQQGQATGNWGPVQVDYDSQGSAANIGQFQLSSPNQQYSIYPFADTGLNGQTITLSGDVRYYVGYCPPPGNCPLPGYMEVYVTTITSEAYNFYLSRRRYYDSNGNPFAEPAPLASNVRNGYGLVCGATDATFRIALP